MSNYGVRAMKPSDLEVYYQYIKRDFPVGEYAPYDILLQQLRDGRQRGVILHEGGQDLAYAFCSGNNEFVLIGLLAVLPPRRGQGLGSKLLAALQRYYADWAGLIVEVERPELASNEKEQRTRQARLHFYRQAVFYLIPDIEYTIWGVPMHLMACPLQMDIDNIFARIETTMYEIYLKQSGSPYIHNLMIKRIAGDQESN